MGKKRRTRAPVGCTAIELADAFLAEQGRSEKYEVDMTREAVMLAAEFLAEVAGPARWDAFDAKLFFRRIEFMQPREKEGIALILMGFYGWLSFSCRLDPGIGVEIMEGIRDQFPSSRILGILYGSAGPKLREVTTETNGAPRFLWPRS